jgi:hypothetical protein
MNFVDLIVPKSIVSYIKNSYKFLGIKNANTLCIFPIFEPLGFVGIAIEAVLGILLIVGFMHFIIALQDEFIYKRRRRMPKPPYMGEGGDKPTNIVDAMKAAKKAAVEKKAGSKAAKTKRNAAMTAAKPKETKKND